MHTIDEPTGGARARRDGRPSPATGSSGTFGPGTRAVTYAADDDGRYGARYVLRDIFTLLLLLLPIVRRGRRRTPPSPPDGGRWFYSKVTENPTPRSSRDPHRGRLIARRPYKRVRSLAIITRNGHDRLRFFFFVSSWVLPSRQSRFFHGTITRKSILRREDREIVHSRTYLRKRKFILDHTRSIPLDLTRKLYNMAQPGFI